MPKMTVSQEDYCRDCDFGTHGNSLCPIATKHPELFQSFNGTCYTKRVNSKKVNLREWEKI